MSGIQEAPITTLDMKDDVKELETTDHLEHTQVTTPYSDEGPPPKVTWRTLLAIFSLGIGYGTNYGVGANMPPAVILTISADFGPKAMETQSWIALSWLVCFGISFAIAGRLSDIFGRRYVIIGGNLLGAVGFTLGGTTHNYNTLIGGLSCVGIAAGMISASVAAVSELLPNKRRPYGVAFLELCIAPLGYFGGSYIAHVLTEKASWRWIFYLGAIAEGICALAVALTYWPPKEGSAAVRDGRTKYQEFVNLDWIGLFMFSGSMASFLLGVTWAGGLYPSTSAWVIAPIACGLAGLIAFGFYEYYVAKDDGIIPPRLFRGGHGVSFMCVLIVKFVAAAMFFTQVTLWPQEAGTFYATSFIDAGVLSFPSGGGFVLGGFVLSLFITKFGHTGWQLRVAITWMVVFCAAQAGLSTTSRGLACFMQFMFAVPFLYILNLAYLTAQMLNDNSDIGVASGLTGTFRGAGGSVGTAIYVTVFMNKVRSTVPPAIAAAAIAAGLPQSSAPDLITALMAQNNAAVAQIPGITPEIIGAAVGGLKEGYLKCFNTVWLATLGFGIPGIIASFFVGDVSDRLRSNEVAVKMQTDKQDARRDAMAMEEVARA